MKARCYNKKSQSYCRYGARGILVCDRWMESFENFYADMGDQPKGLQIDRINNDENYSKENCRWVSPKENASNRSSSRFIDYNGEIKTVAEWARVIGITRQGLRYRLEMGYSVHDCINKKNFYCKLQKEN
jgi:hypothetical protein